MHSKLKQEKQDLEKEFNKNPLEKDEDFFCLRNICQGLIEKVKKLEDDKLENQDIKNKIKKLENEELSCIMDHNQSLLAQSEKLVIISYYSKS